MHKSTVIFAGLAVLLAAGTAAVVWHLWPSQNAPRQPDVSGVADALGLPGLRADEEALFDATSALLYDRDAQSILFEQNGFERVPIASITKLMTAMVALDHGFDWDQPVTIEPREYVIGGQLLLHPGETATMRDLFHVSLVSSANNVTLAYVRMLGIPPEEFVREMNRKAIEIGLEQTTFTDVTGLDPENISTAYEVARLADAAFSNYPEIAAATARAEYTFKLGGSDREHTVRNSNKAMTAEHRPFAGSKTGFLYEAGYCLVTQGTGDAKSRIAVILGSPSEQGHFADIERLLSFVRFDT